MSQFSYSIQTISEITDLDFFLTEFWDYIFNFDGFGLSIRHPICSEYLIIDGL